MDAVQKADSGHPGLPMGCAEIGAYLYGRALRYNPKNRNGKIETVLFFLRTWFDASLLLLASFRLRLTLEDLKNFRQWHSKTPGHPESLDTVGVETTTDL